MQEELVTKLLSFGLTINQAKVYLSILQAGTTSVNKIAKDTKLHRQDIYKMLPKLERMGLITKTIDMPFRINAVPIENGLYDLLSVIRQKSQENLRCLESNIKELINQVKVKPIIQDETRLTLLTTDKAIKNREDLSFETTTSSLNLILDKTVLNTAVIRYVCERFQTLLDKGVEINLLIEVSEISGVITNMLSKISDTNGRLTVKLSRDVKSSYQIFDNSELCIATQQKTESGFPCLLWTNDANMIFIYSEHFARIWQTAEFLPLTVASIA